MLEKFLSPNLIDRKINVSLLILRVISGLVMIPHGYKKLISFSEKSGDFMNFLGLSGEISLALLIGAEFFCAILLVAGLFSRFALIPLVVAMFVAAFDAHSGEIFGDGETSFLYLACYISLLISGPGKWSLDYLLFGKKN
ncbi:MAG: DoxX family protein [Bacteroidia bacterium]